MSPGEALRQHLDDTCEANQESSHRRHLGASVVGEKCARMIWFKFRWTKTVKFPGRMCRLFQRGHREEPEFVESLRKLGATVWTHDPATGKQFQISDCGGHFGGSCDGVAVNIPKLPVGPDEPVLLEMKTHNDKQFGELVKKGVKTSHPKHFKQAQTYMRKLGINWCLYMAVNKNDDDVYFYFFQLEPEVGDSLLRRAASIIYTDQAPARISDSPSWYECRFCDMRGVCFGTEMPEVNCRTCAHSTPAPNGTWKCRFDRPEISAMPEKGCEMHIFNPTFFPHATVEAMSLEENSVTYQTRNRGKVVNGSCVTATPSKDLDLTC
jgi:hypothetical protein